MTDRIIPFTGATLRHGTSFHAALAQLLDALDEAARRGTDDRAWARELAQRTDDLSSSHDAHKRILERLTFTTLRLAEQVATLEGQIAELRAWQGSTQPEPYIGWIIGEPERDGTPDPKAEGPVPQGQPERTDQ